MAAVLLTASRESVCIIPSRGHHVLGRSIDCRGRERWFGPGITRRAPPFVPVGRGPPGHGKDVGRGR